MVIYQDLAFINHDHSWFLHISQISDDDVPRLKDGILSWLLVNGFHLRGRVAYSAVFHLRIIYNNEV